MFAHTASSLSFVVVIMMVSLTMPILLVTAYPQLQFRLPNGDNIYRKGEYCPALGHKDHYGNDPTQLNPFGMYMKVEGMHWTQQTCHGDADGDGYTNGEELGDPDCVWAMGHTPSRTTDLSHPGYADSFPKTFKSASQVLADENEANMQAMLEEAKRVGGGSSEPLTEKQEALLLEKILASHKLNEAEIRRSSPDAIDDDNETIDVTIVEDGAEEEVVAASDEVDNEDTTPEVIVAAAEGKDESAGADKEL